MLNVVNAVAAEIGWPAAQVALAWVIARPGVASTLIGASKVAQLEANIAATEVRLDAEQTARLDAASAPMPGVSASLGAPAVRRMVFGGQAITGWGEARA